MEVILYRLFACLFLLFERSSHLAQASLHTHRAAENSLDLLLLPLAQVLDRRSVRLHSAHSYQL